MIDHFFLILKLYVKPPLTIFGKAKSVLFNAIFGTFFDFQYC